MHRLNLCLMAWQNFLDELFNVSGFLDISTLNLVQVKSCSYNFGLSEKKKIIKKFPQSRFYPYNLILN